MKVKDLGDFGNLASQLSTSESEIVDKACKVLLCRQFHQDYLNVMLNVLGEGVVDPDVCKFGNDDEHKDFFRKLNAYH